MAKKKIPETYINEMLAGREPEKLSPVVAAGRKKGEKVEKVKREQRNIYIAKDVWRALRRYALDSGESASQIIERLLRDFLRL